MNNDGTFNLNELRSKQLKAIHQCLLYDLLAAKVTYQDRLRRFDFENITHVTRVTQPIAEAFLGIEPICFMRN